MYTMYTLGVPGFFINTILLFISPHPPPPPKKKKIKIYLVSTQCGTQQPLTQHILIPPNQIKSTLSGVPQSPP